MREPVIRDRRCRSRRCASVVERRREVLLETCVRGERFKDAGLAWNGDDVTAVVAITSNEGRYRLVSFIYCCGSVGADVYSTRWSHSSRSDGYLSVCAGPFVASWPSRKRA